MSNTKAITAIENVINGKAVQEAVINNFTPAQAKVFNNNALSLFMENKQLQDCTLDSITKAIIDSARYQLPLSKDMGLAYVIPYGDQAQFMPSYRGLIHIVKRSGAFKEIEATLVYENDLKLSEQALVQKLFAVIKYNPNRNNDMVIGALAGAKTADGEIVTEFMDINDVMQIRKHYSKGSERAGSAWMTRPDDMVKKTVIKRLIKHKLLPQAFEKGLVIDVPDEQNEIVLTAESNYAETPNETSAQRKGNSQDVSGDPERFERMMEAIRSGRYSIEQAEAGVIMSDEQRAQFNALKAELVQGE